MKVMEHQWGDSLDIRIGAISGAICAILKLLDIYLLADPYMIVLFKVFLTAILGGAGGVLGKHLVTFLMKKWKEKFSKNKQQ
jgi:hypothetical protein